MRRLIVIFMVFVIASFMLSACNSNSTESKQADKNKASEVSQKGIPSKMIEEASSKYVSEKNAIDERRLLENGVKKQRTLLKPGFVKGPEFDYSTEFRFSDTENFIEYDQYYAVYDGEKPPRTPEEEYLSFIMSANTASDDSNGILDDEKVYNEYKHDKMDLKFTYDDDPKKSGDVSYQLWGRYDQSIYVIFGSTSNLKFNEKLVAEIAQSLKSEEEGAYDPFYEMFLEAFDLDTIKFPQINKEQIQSHYYDLRVSEDFSDINYRYSYNEDEDIRYIISTKEFTSRDHEAEEIVVIDDVEVTKYVTSEDEFLYYWTDGTYHYTLDAGDFYGIKKVKSLEEEDYYAIIQSSIRDNRQFKNKDVFKPIVTEPNLSEKEEKLYQKLMDLKQDN